MLILVYGTLKRNFGNNYLLDKGKFVGLGVIDGYKLIYSYDVGSFPYAIENEGTGIRGEVYDISGDYLEHTVRNLDSLEGHPAWYRRTKAHTRDDRNVEFYLMPHPHDEQIDCDYNKDENYFEWRRG